MRNRCFVALGVALLIGFLVADAQARPGGRRGSRPRAGSVAPGNVRPGNVQPGGQIGQGIRNSASQLKSLAGGNVAGNLGGGNFQNKVSQLKTNFTPANQPFTPAWYASHPRAWQYTHPHADAWAVATLGTTAAWLGIAATTNVYTGDNAENDATDSGAADVDSTAAGDFLPLGVFALAPKSEKDATVLVQLAVTREGEVRGNYYDVLTGQDHPVTGTVDKQTQQATFKTVPGGNVTFETTLANLTRAAGSVTLRLANGQTRQWTLARFDDAAPQAK